MPDCPVCWVPLTPWEPFPDAFRCDTCGRRYVYDVEAGTVTEIEVLL